MRGHVEEQDDEDGEEDKDDGSAHVIVVADLAKTTSHRDSRRTKPV